MRILVISNAYPSSEKPYAGVFVKAQVNGLRALGAEIEVFAMRRAFTTRLGSVRKYLAAYARFIPRLWRRYDVVHVHFLSPLLALGWLYCVIHPRCRLVLTVHGSGVRIAETRPRLRSCYRVLVRRADFVQAVGQQLARDFERLSGRGVDLVQPAGVDRAVFRPMPDESKEYDFVFVGSLTTTKGFDLLLDALQLLQPPPRVCVIGTGELASRIDGASGITYLKSLPPNEVARHLNKARFLVHPTRMDAFGLVVAEAMCCGIPAITSAVDGMLEQVAEGRNGFFVRSTTPTELARVMDQALSLDDESYRELREGALAVNPAYSLEAVCRRLVEIYGVRR